MDILILRLDAPLMSFGGVAVDNLGPTEMFPTQSMLTGLIGNALGYDHSQWQQLQRLQDRIRYAARQDRAGTRLADFQTVALGQEHLVDRGWTTQGVRENRAGASGKGTHIRYRDYLADAAYTVALALLPGDPSLERVEHALRFPERPLFFGRKPCLPAGLPIVVGQVQAESLLQALRQAPPIRPAEAHDTGPTELPAIWPADEPHPGQGQPQTITDTRDWVNQVHVGRRLVHRGFLRLQEVNHEQ